MKIDVRDIPSEGLSIALNENAGALGLDDIQGSVGGTLSLLRSGTSVSLDGSLRASLKFCCGRCLEEFSRVLDLDVNVVLEKAGGAPAKETELKGEDLDVSFYSGQTINLDDLVREEIFLNLPMRPLCRDDCLGLCPRCGKDLNLRACDCFPVKEDLR